MSEMDPKDTPMDTASPVDQASMDADEPDEKSELNDSSMESPRPATEAMDQGEGIADAAMTSPAAEDRMETASPEGVVSMEAEELADKPDTATAPDEVTCNVEEKPDRTTSREDDCLEQQDTQDYSAESQDQLSEEATQDYASEEKDNDQQPKDVSSPVEVKDETPNDQDSPEDGESSKDEVALSKEVEAADSVKKVSSEGRDSASTTTAEESATDVKNLDQDDDGSSELGMITNVVGNADAEVPADGKEGGDEAPMFQISCVQSGVSMDNEESSTGGASQTTPNADTSSAAEKLQNENKGDQKKKNQGELETVTRMLSPSQIKQEVEETVSETTASEKAESVALSSTSSAKVKSEPVDNETPKDSDKPKEGKKSDKPKTKKSHKCIVCATVGKCKYNIVRNGDVKHLCNDQCFKTFRANPSQYLTNSSEVEEPAPAEVQVRKPIADDNACRNCRKTLPGTQGAALTWHSADFCGVPCLEYYQRAILMKCQACNKMIHHTERAQYSSLIYDNAYQFCSADCMDDFNSSVSHCAFCRRHLPGKEAVFKRAVNNGTFVHEFCSHTCHRSFERRAASITPSMVSQPKASSDKKTGRSTRSASGLATCASCGKMSTYKHEIATHDGMSKFCNDTCYAAYRIKHKYTSNLCGYCSIPCLEDDIKLSHNDMIIRFCTYACVARFKRMNKEQVACAWCSHRRIQFDMIRRKTDVDNKRFCTIKCLQLYKTNIVNSKLISKCDNCEANATAQYHLTMSDGTVRNFCSYACVMTFQDQFKKKPAAPLKQLAPKAAVQYQAQAVQYQAPTAPQVRPPASQTMPGRNMLGPIQVVAQPRSNGAAVRAKTAQSNAIPVISNVMSLAPLKETPPAQKPATSTVSMQTVVKKEAIVEHPPAPSMRNKVVLCKPICQTKATTCRPNTTTRAVETDPLEDPRIPIPVPVPIYVPIPVIMYQTPTPQPIPIPVPVPIPIFIPTGGGTAEEMIARMNAVKERVPEDPFEAELLMMAEAVAGAGDSESDQSPVKGKECTETNGEAEKSKGGSALFQNDADILSMALKMAERMEGEELIHLDLESSLDANSGSEAETSRRGTKRGTSTRGRTRSKKRARTEVEPPAPAKPAADANCLLKFTYGLNAWEHWVRNKNSELETDDKKPRSRPFKTDPLECSPDELNYALSLFVREVRKPNGAAYAADSIYYLCLGIQAYLYSNQRTDNIFTDIYYEKFTDCLNEVVRGYVPKLSATGQLVCRLDEEHLWECKQLGAHSPHVLLNTLIYFNTRFFQRSKADQHLKLAFTQVMKAWRRNPPGSTPSRTVYLRYYPPTKDGRRRKDDHDDVLEQEENLDNPLRCPVKLFEFYVSKCPECVRNRSDLFYLIPERSCVPDSPVWYSVSAMGPEAMEKMLNRVKMVRELQEM